MINIKNKINEIDIFLHTRSIGRLFEDEIQFKFEMLRESLLNLTNLFNSLLLTCDAADYKKLCAIFRLSVPLYDARYLAYKDQIGCKPFDTTVSPSQDNIGFSDENKIFNYLIHVPTIHRTWNARTYIHHIKNINSIIDSIDILILIIDEMSKYMSFNLLHDLLMQYGAKINTASELQVIALDSLKEKAAAIIRANIDEYNRYEKRKK